MDMIDVGHEYKSPMTGKGMDMSYPELYIGTAKEETPGMVGDEVTLVVKAKKTSHTEKEVDGKKCYCCIYEVHAIAKYEDEDEDEKPSRVKSINTPALRSSLEAALKSLSY